MNAEPKRILLIAPQPFFEPRGTPINVLQMCKVLTRAGYRVDLATYPLGETPTIPGLEVHRCLRVPGIRSVPPGFSKRKVLLDAVLGLTVGSLLVRRRYDLVHAVEEAVFIALPLTWLGMDVVYDLDSVMSEQLRDTGVVRSPLILRGMRAMERLALRRARAAVTVCSALSEMARNEAPGTTVFQIEDTPLQDATREPDPAVVEAHRDGLGLDERPTVVYTGNLQPYQGINLLLAAAALVRREMPEAAFVLVGGSGQELEELRRHVETADLESTVFGVGRRPPTEMPEWMAVGDALISPRSQGDNTPLKIYTYMRSGRPIIATRLPTHTQVLDSESAFLSEPTPEAMSQTICRALRNPEDAAGLAAEARRRVESDYSVEAFERKLLAAYRTIFGGPE